MQINDHNEKEYLKELAPTLFGKKHGITADAPAGYFESMPEKLKQRIAHEAESKPQGILVRMVNYRNLAIAAGLALILASIPFMKAYFADGQPQNLAEIVVLDYSDEESLDAIAAWVDEDVIYAEVETEDLAYWNPDCGFSPEDISEYLMEEGVAEELLYETTF